MKKYSKKLLFGFMLGVIMMLAMTCTASAKITFPKIYAQDNGNVRMLMKASSTESKVVLTFRNLRTNEYFKKSTSYNYLDVKLAKNTWFQVKVQGYNRSNKLVSTRTIYTCNNPISGVKFSVNRNYSRPAMNVSWPSVYGSTGYKVYMSSDGGNTFKGVATQRGTTYTAKNLTLNKRYYFKVRPYKTVNGTTTVGPTSTYSYGTYIYRSYYYY